MVSEIRQIVFSNCELIRAIVEFDRAHCDQLPKHRVLECQISSEPINVTLTFDTAWREDKFVELNETALTAVLIHACGVNGIPLPRGAIKSLQSDGDNLMLSFSVTTKPVESDFEERSQVWGEEEQPPQPH